MFVFYQLRRRSCFHRRSFLFPLVLVPILKNLNPTYVIIASGICTAVMIIPTALLFKEPAKQKQVEEKAKKREQTSLIQTLANAFEIIYSPIVLLYNLMKKSSAWKIIIIVVLVSLLGLSGMLYMQKPPTSESFPTIGIDKGNTTLIFKVERNMLKKDPYELKAADDKTPSTSKVYLTIYKPIEFLPKNL